MDIRCVAVPATDCKTDPRQLADVIRHALLLLMCAAAPVLVLAAANL